MDALIDNHHPLPSPFAPDIEPPIVLLTVSPQVLDDSNNCKFDDPQPLVDIPYGDAKMDDVPPLVVPALDAALVGEPVVVSIDQREQFTTKRKFASSNELLGWVREEARKVGFTIVICESDNGGNGRNAFVTLICQRRSPYTEYKKLSKRKITGLVKCE